MASPTDKQNPGFVQKAVTAHALKALEAAGIVVPNDPNLQAKFSAELSKRGIDIGENLTLIANGNYVLVVPD
jgi:hypothetical protein